ncbi:MAG: HAD-IIB family hydrolase [bacterium]|nr:HAD-IIB family hydrolase [bacterium]
MKITNIKKLEPKKLIVFDLDGTLARTKTYMDEEMTELVTQLLQVKKVAIIGGGKYALFKHQFLQPLKGVKRLMGHLYLFPTTATAFYRYQSGWKNVYLIELTKEERKQIKSTFEIVFQEIGYEHPEKVYGKVIEDRGTQVTFSALGQEVVAVLGKKGVEMKEEWVKHNKPLKMKIARLMQKYLPNLAVRAAGHTSVDVTKKGIDKAFGLKQIEKHLKIKIKDMVFIGDGIFPGGNDYAITTTAVDYIPVKDPEDTKKIIRHILTQ